MLSTPVLVASLGICLIVRHRNLGIGPVRSVGGAIPMGTRVWRPV